MRDADQQLVVATGRRDTVPNTAARPAPRATVAPGATDHLSGAQKAAIIVRLLLAEGMDTPIASLPHDLQTELTQTLGSMRLVDRATLCAVVEEFMETLDQVGLSFPDGLDGALSLLEGRLDARATTVLRAISRGSGTDDPWSVLERAENDDLLQILGRESQVVGAVLLSKLSTDKAARLLSSLPSEQAQALALAISRTEDIAPDIVARIGATLADQVCAKPLRAFAAPPSKRMGEILNASPATLRDQLLRDIESRDQGFASGIRKSIFTYRDIPVRLSERDVPIVMRDLSSGDLMLVLAADYPDDRMTNAFLLDNMSKRMADTLREDSAALPPPELEAYDSAAARIAGVVRSLADARTITLKPLPP